MHPVHPEVNEILIDISLALSLMGCVVMSSGSDFLTATLSTSSATPTLPTVPPPPETTLLSLLVSMTSLLLPLSLPVPSLSSCC